ncbi:MAG: hypothetical protein KDA91_04545 [Planctomycetaceae bacterium]|nr:hypothetical protein [Planctomycetaceae bacterium]
MSDSANVSSLEAVCRFAASVMHFQQEARLCMTAWDSQLRQVQFWLERDRPGFWKREIECCSRDVADARIRLHQCRMRRVGDFRPTCFEEQKDLEQAKRNLEFSTKQIPRVKQWNMATQHEANEFHGRSGAMVQMLEREIPRLLALLKFSIDRLQAYADIATPEGQVMQSRLGSIVATLEKTIQQQAEAMQRQDESAADHQSDSPADLMREDQPTKPVETDQHSTTDDAT